jgi:SAM-dependent methyltransferase
MHAAEYQFDAILCTEVLEHIRDDRSICEKFFQLLKPGGVLHITTPNANHPYNIAFPLDHAEQGGHVRPGYTEAMYYDLLNPLGFQVNEVRGLGGKWRQTFDDLIKRAQEKFGPYAGIPLFGLSLPFLLLDLGTPRVPFCLYVNATRAS